MWNACLSRTMHERWQHCSEVSIQHKILYWYNDDTKDWWDVKFLCCAIVTGATSSVAKDKEGFKHMWMLLLGQMPRWCPRMVPKLWRMCWKVRSTKGTTRTNAAVLGRHTNGVPCPWGPWSIALHKDGKQVHLNCGRLCLLSGLKPFPCVTKRPALWLICWWKR